MKKSVIMSIVSVNGKNIKTTVDNAEKERKIPTQTANPSGDNK